MGKTNAEYVRDWRLRNAGKIRAYYEKNKERIAQYSREWREKNPDRVKVLENRWKTKNPEYMRQYLARWRKENKEKNKKKYNPQRQYKYNHSPQQWSRMRLRDAIKVGRVIRPASCSQCGEACKPEGHHPDYSKPLEVIWLCGKCHRLTHASVSPSVRLTP